MKKRKLPNIPKLSARWKAAAVGFAALFAATALEEIKQLEIGKLTPWESHAVTIAHCAALAFLLSAVFFRREEAKVRETAALNESLMEGLPGVVCVFDSSGQIRRANTDFLGYSAEEMMRTGIISTVAPDSLETVQQTMKTAFETGTAESEAWLLAKNGKKIPCYLTGVRIIFENELCVVGIALDLSKRKQAQEQVRLQSAALEAAANAIVITDTMGTIQWVNPAFTQLTGYALEEAVGHNPRVLKSKKHDESFYSDLWNTILAGKVWTGELTNRRKDGQTYFVRDDHCAGAFGKRANYQFCGHQTERNRTETYRRGAAAKPGAISRTCREYSRSVFCDLAESGAHHVHQSRLRNDMGTIVADP